jgi:hypothetical protein
VRASASRSARNTPRSVISPLTTRRLRHVETVIGDRRAVGDDPNCLDPAVCRAPRHGCDLIGATLLDLNLPDAVVDGKIDRRGHKHPVSTAAVMSFG